MINKLVIENYQSHLKTEIEFDQGINVFYGPSDSGKSSVIRALRALLYRDNFYLNYFENSGRVALEFDSNKLERKYSISKLRKCPNCKENISDEKICKCGEILTGKTASDIYLLNDKEYKSFGVNLPDEINNILKLSPIKFIDIEENINFFNQFDDLFFVGKSYNGSVKTKIISSLIPDSEKVENLIKKFNSESLSKSSELEYLESHTEELQVLLEKNLTDFQACDKLNSLLEEDQEILQDNETDLGVISKNYLEIQKCSNLLKFEKKILQAKSVFESIENSLKKLQEMQTKLDKISSIFSELKKVQKLSDITIQKFEDISFEEIKEKETKINRLNNLKDRIKMNNEYLDLQHQEIEKEKEKLLKKKTELQTILDTTAICPITNQAYCDSCKQAIMEKTNG
jgi:DNA repair ATPase RecN